MSIAVSTVRDMDRLTAWLDRVVRPALTADFSNYAKGRPRCWLGVEPPLTNKQTERPGLGVRADLKKRLEDLIQWPFDYCLVTYSGDETPIGIAPHRDAGYADFEAFSLTATGKTRFDYWEGRRDFGRCPNEVAYLIDRELGRVTVAGEIAPPTTSLEVGPGELVRFNCKNPHASTPSVGRWNLNFWRAKSETRR